jgi:hypothetical protein
MLKQEVDRVGDQWEKRISDILKVELNEDGLSEGTDGLPQVTYKTLEQYQRYLEQNLIFPFHATYEHETGPLKITEFQVKVVGLEEMIDDHYGLLCEGRDGRKKKIVALAELAVDRNNPNYGTVDDYLTWFWNCR